MLHALKLVASTLNTKTHIAEAMDNKSMDTKKKNLLPHELMVEILLRLPVKSLIRFKSVSKPWRSLISDTHFTKSHLDLAAAPTNRFLYTTAYGSDVRWVDVDTSIHRDL